MEPPLTEPDFKRQAEHLRKLRVKLAKDTEALIVRAARDLPDVSYTAIGTALGYAAPSAGITVRTAAKRAGIPPRTGGPRRRTARATTEVEKGAA